ncbi:MAG: hypothetical protein ACI8UO_005991 [Verrucomicrobiales bacterium]|jgi:hypothetical protein
MRLIFAILIATTASAFADSRPTFEKDIRPILKTHCFQCHGEEGELKGGLDVRLRRFLERGGESGPAITPGDSAKSHIVQKLKAGEMPKGKNRLPDAEIALIEAWITDGALTARPEPEELGPEHAFTEEDRAWWAFQPIEKPEIPREAKNPIDAFIAARLETAKLSFSDEADRITLIRRLTFDLTGLPPTPEQLEATDLDQFAEQLLASPAYGERWARHWLDVAGYADSDGYTDKDLVRPDAWRYRDYVIRALNEDKPFDAFVREQLAGDELAATAGLNANSPTPEERDRYEQLMVATGFLRMAPDGTGALNNITSRNDCVASTIKIVSTALYGMTVGCAQCHDHRYDAITQADYFRLRAVFEPGFDIPNWRNPNARRVSIQTKEEAAVSAEIEIDAKMIDEERLCMTEDFITEVLEREIAKADEADREALHTAYRAVAKDRTDEQNALLKRYPKVLKLSAGSLYLYDQQNKTKHAATIKEWTEKVKTIRDTKPPIRYVQAFTEVAKKPEAVPKTFVFHRGDPESPKDEVKPADLSVLAGWREVAVPENAEQLLTTGRRLAYAESITDGQHPLLARVIVNRAWMHHFGKGLVATAGDFGVLGEAPSHPELLDWLAADFMENGWSLKRLHRQILTSQTWRQSSKRDSIRDRDDPDNRLLSRQTVRRLEAETLRDALLAASGKLNAKLAGKPVPTTPNTEGQIVIGVDTTDTAGRQTGKFVGLEGEEFRRSIYVSVRRSRPLEMFATFDAPSMTEDNCDVRPVTTVSPQSLLLMNNLGMREYAQHFAERLQTDCECDLEGQIERAWLLAFGHPAAPADAATAGEFVRAQTAFYRANPAKLERVIGPAEKENADADFLGLAALCHALMSANEFLYID